MHSWAMNYLCWYLYNVTVKKWICNKAKPLSFTYIDTGVTQLCAFFSPLSLSLRVWTNFVSYHFRKCNAWNVLPRTFVKFLPFLNKIFVKVSWISSRGNMYQQHVTKTILWLLPPQKFGFCYSCLQELNFVGPKSCFFIHYIF